MRRESAKSRTLPVPGNAVTHCPQHARTPARAHTPGSRSANLRLRAADYDRYLRPQMQAARIAAVVHTLASARAQGEPRGHDGTCACDNGRPAGWPIPNAHTYRWPCPNAHRVAAALPSRCRASCLAPESPSLISSGSSISQVAHKLLEATSTSAADVNAKAPHLIQAAVAETARARPQCACACRRRGHRRAGRVVLCEAIRGAAPRRRPPDTAIL